MDEPVGVNRENLEFFNTLSGILAIELSEPPEAISPKLANQKASPTAKIVSLKLNAVVWIRDEQGEILDEREMTSEELGRVVFPVRTLELRSFGATVEHAAKDDGGFCVGDLIGVIEETERRTRGASDWFEGIDVHHVFFEGLWWSGDTWDIAWGS